MPTGLTTAWGYPPGAVANRFKTMLDGDHPLTYELGLTSYPPIFAAGYNNYGSEFQSPLTPIAQSNNVATQSAFGKRKRKTKRKSKSKSKSKKKKIPAKIRRLCKRLGIKLTRKVGRRRVNKSLKQLKKQIKNKKKTLRKKKH